MTHPAGIPRRELTLSPGFDLVSGTEYTAKATLQPTRDLVWAADGKPGVATDTLFDAATPVPVTSAAGWLDEDGNAVDVADGKQSHLYWLQIRYYRGAREVKQTKKKLVAIPSGSGPLDLDSLIAVNPGSVGTPIYVPDTWSGRIADLEALVTTTAAFVKTTIAGAVADPTDPLGVAAKIDTALSSKLSAIYAIQGESATACTARFNTALAAAAGGTLAAFGAFPINGPLVIKSNTTLDASAAEITSTHVGHMIHNERYASTTTRDSNIHIRGGKWQRNAGGPGSGSGSGWANTAHSIFLRHVDRLSIRSIAVGSTGGKYMVAVGDVVDYYVADVEGSSVASDTVHTTGPAKNGVIERVRVTGGGDDVVAFTTTDYDAYNDVAGTIENITVRDVSASNATRIVLLGASANVVADGFVLRGMRVENVTQYGTGAGVSTGGAGNTDVFDDLAVRNVAGSVLLRHPNHTTVSVDNSGPVLATVDGTNTSNRIKSLIIRNPKNPGTSELYVQANANTRVDSLLIEGGQVTGGTALSILNGTVNKAVIRSVQFSGTGHFASLSGSAVIDSLLFDGVKGSNGTTTRHFVSSTGTVLLKSVAFRDVDWTAVDTNSGILVSNSSGSVVNAIDVSNSRLGAIGRVLDVAGGTFTCDMRLTDTVITSASRVAQVSAATLNVAYSNLRLVTLANQPFRIIASGVLTVRGRGWSGYTASAIVRASAEVIRCVGDIPVDLSILAKNADDEAVNTNGALACGVGRAVSNGSAWKNVYSGATY